MENFTFFLIYFSITLLFTFAYLHIILSCSHHSFNKKKHTINSSEFFCSIICAAKNEEKVIKNLIECIKSQTYKNFELIIVDDNSSDLTFAICEEMQKDFPELKVVKSTGKGKKESINYGISIAKYDIIIQTDADCVVGKNWIASLIQNFQHKKMTVNNLCFKDEIEPDMVIAPLISLAPHQNNLFEKLWEAESFAILTVTAGTCQTNNATMCNGANLAYKKSLRTTDNIDLNNKFASGDDIFLLHGAKASNKKIIFEENPEAAVYTQGCKNINELINQRTRWVSKSTGYKDFFTIYTALVIFLENINLLIMPIILTLITRNFTLILIFILLSTLSKLIADYLSVKYSSDYYNKKQKTIHILILELIYPIYNLVLFTKIIGKDKKKKSKGFK